MRRLLFTGSGGAERVNKVRSLWDTDLVRSIHGLASYLSLLSCCRLLLVDCKEGIHRSSGDVRDNLEHGSPMGGCLGRREAGPPTDPVLLGSSPSAGSDQIVPSCPSFLSLDNLVCGIHGNTWILSRKRR